MIIFKSFLRKKITKTYILLFSLILLSIIVLSSISNRYLNIINNKYKDSYISIVLDKKDEFKLKKINNIKDYKVNHIINSNDEFNDYMIITEDDNLSDNEIIIPICYSNKYEINDIYNIYLNNNLYNYTIKNFNEENLNKLIVSTNTYNKISKESYTRQYDIKLTNWLKQEQSINRINKLNLDKDYGLKLHNTNNQDNTNVIIYIINIFLYIMLASFFIIYMISLINIYSDEEQINNILKSLGYKSKKLFILNYLKVLSLIIISTIFSIILFYILKTILILFNIYLYLNWLYIIYIILILTVISIVYNIKCFHK